MQVEATITAPSSLQDLIRHGSRLEEIGFDTILVPEAGHDPFLPIMTLAEHTSRARLGTGIAVAFPRSPFVTAQLAWDLQRFTGGRFLLGLGTQVKAHNVRRYSTPWEGPPAKRLRDYIRCLKAIFANFAHGTEPDYEGDYYQFKLNTPFFNPGPIEGVDDVPIYVGAVNERTFRVCGEVADGLRMHPLNTRRYIEEVVRPAVEAGAEKAGRDVSGFDYVVNPFTATGRNAEEVEEARALIRKHMSYYAATPTYRAVMVHHGWEEIGDELVRLSRAGRWDDMPALVTDEMFDELALVGTLDEIPDRLRERYGGVVTTVNLVFGPPYLELQARQRRMFESVSEIMEALQAVC